MKLSVVPKSRTRGVLYEFADLGIPVVNMLNIKKIAAEEGMAVDSVPLPGVGEGGVYYRTVYSRTIIVIALIIIFVLVLPAVLFGRLSHKKNDELAAQHNADEGNRVGGGIG